ncbi:hypothetical protein BJX63DRAFT_438715 [Aspergillus granulosus]|uniref:Zn(2)-C6 fungal-type domain-containing protein n=1 Tax=Aspergillus granulosus TaxID=176169 RepID=A0ABR4GSN0_9EURO
MDHRSHRPLGTRVRAAAACKSCHDRKVRCDYLINGSPCTNCRHDRRSCTLRLKQRTSRSRKPIVQDGPRSPLPSSSPRDDRSVDHCEAADRRHPGLVFGSDILFSAFPFIERPDLCSLPPEDVMFLEMKGCLHVPVRRIMDLLINAYFVHVQPTLPLVGETGFWQIYQSTFSGRERRSETISLFFLQALFFRSCSFIDPLAIQDAGYSDVMHAQDTFYRRAKLLFDLNAEHRHLPKAQGAVLLSYYDSPLDSRAGSQWLSAAIQSAMTIQAHRADLEVGKETAEMKGRKRLWTSICLRDCVVALSLRDPLKVVPVTLSYSVMEDLESSTVYDPSITKVLAQLFHMNCQLSALLALVISLTYGYEQIPLEGDTASWGQWLNLRIDCLKSDLALWEMESKTAIGHMFGSVGCNHPFAQVYIHLLSVYHLSGRILLYHREISLLDACPDTPGQNDQRKEALVAGLHGAEHRPLSALPGNRYRKVASPEL